MPPMTASTSAAVRPVIEERERTDWFNAPAPLPSWSTPLVSATPKVRVVTVLSRLSAEAVRPPARARRPLLIAV